MVGRMASTAATPKVSSRKQVSMGAAHVASSKGVVLS